MIKNIAYKFILCLLVLLVGFVTFFSIFRPYLLSGTLNPLILIFGVIIFLLVFLALKKIIMSLSDRKAPIISLILCFIFFILLSIFGLNFLNNPTYDLNDVLVPVNQLLNNNIPFSDIPYLNVYTNQIPLTIVIYGIFKLGSLFHIENLKAFATIINSLSIALSALFTYMSVKELKSSKIGLLALIFFIINPVFYLYSSYFYSDTLCMPFASLAIYLFIKIMKNDDKKNIIPLIIIGLILAIGYKIRAVVGILLIAFIISVWLNKKVRKLLKTTVLLFFGFIIGLVLCKAVESGFTLPDGQNQFPLTHWVMMGLNTETSGVWSQKDFDYTLESTDKVNDNIKMIKTRISNMSLKDAINLYRRKLTIVWTNGLYGGHYKIRNVEHISGAYEYISGNRNIVFLYYAQICKIILMIGVLYLLIKEIKNKEKSNLNVLFIAILGAFLFYLIWEVLDRYSLSFLPWLIPLFACFIDDLKIPSIELKDNKKILISAGIILITLILLGTNYSKYSLKTNTFEDKAVNQFAYKNNIIGSLEEKVIEQSFITSKSFNNISLQIKKNGSVNTNYKLTLLDKDNIIYETIFNSEDITKDEYQHFRMPLVEVKGKKEFTIKLESIDATSDNSIYVASYFEEGFNIYPVGTFKINNTEEDASLLFIVSNIYEGTYFNKTLYILGGLIILLIEGCSLYICFGRSKKKGLHFK